MIGRRTLALSLVIGVATALAGRSESWAPALTTAVTGDDNLSNSDRGPDEVSALLFEVELDARTRRQLSRNLALSYGAAAAVEAVPEFSALDTGRLGPRLGLHWKSGLGPYAPGLHLESTADWITVRETDRGGLAGSLALSWTKRWTDVDRCEIGVAATRHDARGPVFSRTGWTAGGHYTRDLSERWSLQAGLQYREGDVVSHATPPRPDLVAHARARTPVSTFDRSFVAYRLEAQTWSASAGMTCSLNNHTALGFQFERRDSTGAGHRYINQLVTARLVLQF
ncbi:MAG: hypothetical protein A3G75_09315 [Verrucomicrobia bacterium RIFCSPLOWO2_12_FULL_64_8]|nr:MAG: hypothetical protein A3G75_09315 [Verrucomicrobia bacterium RIFCSPLOWO2_12_FULL_64_8]